MASRRPSAPEPASTSVEAVPVPKRMDESGACSARMSAHADTLTAVLTKKLRVSCRRRSARSAAVEVDPPGAGAPGSTVGSRRSRSDIATRRSGRSKAPEADAARPWIAAPKPNTRPKKTGCFGFFLGCDSSFLESNRPDNPVHREKG